MARTVATATSMQRELSGRESRWIDRGLAVTAYAVIVIGALTMVIPFVWMVTTSLKDVAEAAIFPPRVLPRQPLWSNYVDVFVKVPFARILLNTVVIATLGVAGQVLTTSLAGFTFARLRFKGRGVVFMVLLATLMIPHQVTLVPQYLLFKQFGWINTYFPLTVPYWLGGAFGTFLMRQYFLTIPQDLFDAARVDGCNPFRIYWQIFMPLAGPALATLALFTFMGRWNDLLGPLICLNKVEMMTVTVGITYFVGQYYTDIPMVMATSVVSMLPTVAAFLFAQRYFVQGVVLSGIKG
jgi:ABC-type glycerol-3-phosphate transport system permease component